MGYSLCAGLAACLERGDTGRAVCVAGDGGIQMAINELGTVKQIFANSKTKYKLLLVIFDNEELGRVLFGFEGSLGTALGPSPDFVALAKAYGGDGVTLSDYSKLDEVMKTAFASTGLFVIHALTDPTIKADMAVVHDTSIKMMNSG
jgi:acetolactate synthase-1/2/3 large subunit